MTATTIERESTTGHDTEQVLQTGSSKPDCAHIVLGNGEESGIALVMRARVEGFEVTALCGYTWIPHRSAAGLPVCQECVDIYSNDPHGHGDRDRLPDE